MEEKQSGYIPKNEKHGKRRNEPQAAGNKGRGKSEESVSGRPLPKPSHGSPCLTSCVRSHQVPLCCTDALTGLSPQVFLLAVPSAHSSSQTEALGTLAGLPWANVASLSTVSSVL